MDTDKLTTKSIEVGRNSSSSGSDEYELYAELGFKEKDENGIEIETGANGEEELNSTSTFKYGSDFIGFDGGYRRNSNTFSGKVKVIDDEDLIKIKIDDDDAGLTMKELDVRSSNLSMSGRGRRRRRQTMNRSNMIAKQVISIQSAISLGFVSQLWVDTNSWVVLVVEIRPKLLSGELERFLLEDIAQVGDVVLIEGESVMENEIKMVGLETLVGYNVVTPGQQNIGKVRGYTFNINSGDVESLELDSFGISIIPSSLVSTYALFVEDVLEVVSDTVVVHEAAASRIQRLTKGFWDAQKMLKSMDELGEYSDLESPVQSDYGRRRRRSSISRNPHPKVGEMDYDWELPMDYL